MIEFTIPLIDENLAQNPGDVFCSYDLEGIELEYPWPKYKPRSLFTGVFIAAGRDGIALSFCAEVPKNMTIADHARNKEKIFEDDCLEFFVQPHGSAVYYCWEINSRGFYLDYRAGSGKEGKDAVSYTMSEPKKTYDGSSKISGYIEAMILENPIIFDYNWQSHASAAAFIEDEFWYTDLFIPWTDFSLGESFSYKNLEGKEWKFTCNRIDNTGMEISRQKIEKSNAKSKGSPKKINPGLQCLIEESEYPSFHQSDFFASGNFQKYGKLM